MEHIHPTNPIGSSTPLLIPDGWMVAICANYISDPWRSRGSNWQLLHLLYASKRYFITDLRFIILFATCLPFNCMMACHYKLTGF